MLTDGVVAESKRYSDLAKSWEETVLGKTPCRVTFLQSIWGYHGLLQQLPRIWFGEKYTWADEPKRE
jgi:hypothetical protein